MTIKKRAFIALKLISFVLVACICVGLVNELLKPKYYYTETWPSTNTTLDFYNLKKNSVDVLMFGSSHCTATLNPQVLYDNYGITSYNLGSEQQSALVTYYWLKEALKYQSPKVVIIDTYTFHKYIDAYVENGMNCSEGSVRKAIDSMRFSSLKWEAAKEIEKYDPTQSALSFLLLNIRYHTRWTGLGENDYTENTMIDHGGVKGFTTSGGSNPHLATFEPFKASDADQVEGEEWVDVAKDYVDKIVDLCDENDIQLIFVNIPYGESATRYKTNKEYAEAKGIPYYDFNEATLYNEIGYNAAKNLLGHPNYLGAEKVSLYVGNLLSSKYNVESRQDKSYDASREIYNHKIENIKLTEETNAYQYLDMLNSQNYSIFVFAPKSYSSCLNEELMGKINNLGFTTNLIGVADGTHYCAVKDSGGITEKLTSEDLCFSNSIRKGSVIYKFNINTDVMLEAYQTYSMTIDGTECGNQNAGIDIVVYDNDLKCIVDKVNINTTLKDFVLTHY